MIISVYDLVSLSIPVARYVAICYFLAATRADCLRETDVGGALVATSGVILVGTRDSGSGGIFLRPFGLGFGSGTFVLAASASTSSVDDWVSGSVARREDCLVWVLVATAFFGCPLGFGFGAGFGASSGTAVDASAASEDD